MDRDAEIRILRQKITELSDKIVSLECVYSTLTNKLNQLDRRINEEEPEVSTNNAYKTVCW